MTPSTSTYPFRLCTVCVVSGALCLTSPVFAQQRPPTVSDIPAEQLRQPTTDEVGLWQLLSHQNNANMVCGGGNKSLAVVQSTGQVVCVSPTPAASNTQARTAVDPNTANNRSASLDKAEVEKQLAAAEAEEERIRSMHKKAEEALKKAEMTLEQANKKADALQTKADATDDPQEKLSLLTEQLELKKAMLPTIRQRDKMLDTAAQLEGQLELAQRQTALARNKLEQARQSTDVASQQQPALPGQVAQSSGSALPQNPSVSFGTPQLPTTSAQPIPSLPFETTTAGSTAPIATEAEAPGYFSQRHKIALEYAFDNGEVHRLVSEALLKQNMLASGVPHRATDITLAIKAQVERINYAKTNGVDHAFWRSAVAEVAETVLVQKIPAADLPLTATKIGFAFAAAYAWGFAYGQ